jgi:hypothetical protein
MHVDNRICHLSSTCSMQTAQITSFSYRMSDLPPYELMSKKVLQTHGIYLYRYSSVMCMFCSDNTVEKTEINLEGVRRNMI